MIRKRSTTIAGTDHSQTAFAVWITGLPASGKSTLTAALGEELRGLGIPLVVLESDALRPILFPESTYSRRERDDFYRILVELGAHIVSQEISVILDATADRRAYRDLARGLIPRFVEVFVSCPLEVCIERDPKGIYRKGRQGLASHVPGLQVPYEAPGAPEVTVRGDAEAAPAAARRIVVRMGELGYLPAEGL